MIQFTHPEAFWLLPVWLVAVWQLPDLRLLKPMRILVVLAFWLAWLDPVINQKTDGLDVWVLQDRSDSALETVEPRLEEIEGLLRESKGPNDRLYFVDFAEEAIAQDETGSLVLPGRRNASRIGNAIQHALSLLNENRHSRLLLLTDGFGTDALDTAGERLLGENVAMDVRMMSPVIETDVKVSNLTLPMQSRPGEPFLIEADVQGPEDAAVKVSLYRDGIRMHTKEVTLNRGSATVQWVGNLRKAGAAQYEVRVRSEADSVLGNNRQSQWVEARGGQRVLLISAYADDPLVPMLSASGFEVQLVTEPRTLNESDLSGVGALIIHNVWAASIPRAFLEEIPFFVREQGGGLMMVGGKASFGAGGYFDSPVDPLLPVSMELKEEDRRMSVAMGIVMDRSGSMGASVAGGTKMDLANAGAARAIELLGATDAVTVFAVDTKAHEIVPLSTIGGAPGTLINLVRSIESMGGGIYVFTGLDAAWKELKKAPQTHKHLILFSDAADSEEPEGVSKLVKEMVANQATVSVIALGSASDSDAAFLETIAKEGQGRLFYNSDATTLPDVFAQETVTVSRSAFLDEPVGTTATPDWAELAATALEWPSTLDGYNLSYLREGASESLKTSDEYKAPLLAHWQRGSGRVVAVSFPLGGDYSETVRSWEEYGDFVRTLGRWMMRKELDPGLALRVQRMGETVRLQLYADDSWEERFAFQAPVVKLRSVESKQEAEHAWRRVSPGLLELDFTPAAGDRVQGAIQVGNRVMPFGPVSGRVGAEWMLDREVIRQLISLSFASGGIGRVDLAEIWQSPQRDELRGIGWNLLWIAFALFLMEAIWDRVGWKRIGFDWKRDRQWKEKPVKSKPVKEILPSKPESKTPQRRSAFDQARHRSRK